MDSVPSDRARALANQALQQPPDSRLAFLRSACGSDHLLLLAASELLSASSHEQPPEASGADVSTIVDAKRPAPAVSKRVQASASFRGTDRFSLGRRLGSGRFGVVYETEDHARDAVVALKLLQNVTADSLYRFKREFRLLADVHHRNLVRLDELFSHEGHWFFTMELVNGQDFLTYVGTTTYRQPAAVDRIPGALRQLVEGLAALHRAGHIHRDVKPTNVLVTPDGRVVVLDFGLLLNIHDEGVWHSLTIAGTPLYMSPEQAAGLPITAASDWYSVGVMLYQALTGSVPFHGNYIEVLERKQRMDPAPPSAVVEGVPPHLDALCRDLLDRNATRRPSDTEILERLATSNLVSPARLRRAEPFARPFVGRQDLKSMLLQAFQETTEGATNVVAVTGPSGIGKSALVQSVLTDIRRRSPNALVLSGRCYQRESVPYKALDAIVDALARHLRRLPTIEAQALLARDVGSMAQIFPVLSELSPRVRNRVTVPADVHEVRRRAYAGLRDTFARVGDRQPIVAFVDDLQWGDVDSATLLAELLRPPDPPVLLFIGAHRDVEVETSAFLRPFYADVLKATDHARMLHLQPLSTSEAEELAAQLLPPALATDTMVWLIAAESGGSPFFVDELVRFAEASGTVGAKPSTAGSDEREATLAHMIVIRQARLPQLAQQLLQLVAVNAKPVPARVLKTAAHPAPEIESALSLLQAEHFLRSHDIDSSVEFETYHDRIREVVSATISPDLRRDYHRRLAAAWEREPTADAELVAEHALEAGDTHRAARFTKLAAEQAEGALAFDRAARLYQRALDLSDPSDSERGKLMLSLGRALVNAGRGGQAAAVYLQTPAATIAETLNLQTQAAQQYLFAGHMADGLAVIRQVLDKIGMALPSSRWRTLLALLRGRAALRLRGLGFRETPANRIPADELMKVDVCWSVAAGLGIIDHMRGAVFQSRHLLLALRLGDLARIHRALCLEVGFVAAAGSRGAKRAKHVRELTAPLTQRLGTPYATAMHVLMDGVNDYLLGNWKAAARSLASAEELFATNCTGVTWELDSTRFFRMWSHYQLGDLQTVKATFPVLLKDAEERGDLYASATINGLFAHVVYLADADPPAAARHTREAIARWAQPGFHMPNLWGVWSETDIALYERRGADAWGHISKAWSSLQRSLLLEAQMIRINMLDLKGRSALAAACHSQTRAERERLLGVAHRCASTMARQGIGWGTALALMLRAGVAAARGEQNEATTLFADAREALSAADMLLHATVAKRRHGQLAGGLGTSAINEADEWMAIQGIQNPSAMAQMFAPHE